MRNRYLWTLAAALCATVGYAPAADERESVEEQLRAEADRKVAVLLAEAERDAQRIRGEGDALAAEIYAKAYNADPEFFAFHRSLEAYRASFKAQGNVLVLDPNSEFFEYFNKVRKP